MQCQKLFQGARNRKFTMGPMQFFFCKLNLRDARRKIGKIVTDIYGTCASLIGMSYFWQDSPLFFGPKNENFTMVAMGTFCIVTNSQRPTNGDLEFIVDICHTGDFH